MSVYVDKQRAKLGRMLMCHMVADTLDELHTMAALIGMRRMWFQASPPASHPHYDLSLSRRALAVKAGAIELDKYGLVEVIRRLRAETAVTTPEPTKGDSK